MNTETKPKLYEYGLLVQRRKIYGTDYIEATVCKRTDEYHHPIGTGGDSGTQYDDRVPKHLHDTILDGLGLRGCIYESGPGSEPRYLHYEPGYHDLHSATLSVLLRMVRTLKIVWKHLAKDKAREPGDQFMSLARALKLTFVAVRDTNRTGPTQPEDWAWYKNIEDGRNVYRRMIEDAQAEAMQRFKRSA
jgi:hypothetical protein